MNKTLTILSHWKISKHSGKYYCPSIHYIYLQEMSKLYKQIYLMAPVKNVLDLIGNDQSLIKENNICIIELPFSKHYLQALKFFFHYKKAIQYIDKYTDVYYCRTPDPYCWLPTILSKKPTIMHFVGDAIDTAKNNIGFSKLKKIIYIAGFKIEWQFITHSAKRSTVYTNGKHLAQKLSKKNIDATPVVSSTISEKDCIPSIIHKELANKKIELIYIGYLRYSKGIDTIIDIIKKLKYTTNINFNFNIIGDGEMFNTLSELIKEYKLENNITLYGHINDRKKLLKILKESDIFVFPSLSEGSPRVVIEAMSQGVLVLSTPVGSLPSSFTDLREIMFFPFRDSDYATNRIKEIINNTERATFIRNNALHKTKRQFTIEKFIKTITTPK